jgi:hypothetical protein
MYTIPPEITGRQHHTESIAPERKKNMMRFGLNVEDKKTLVKRIGELTGQQPHYTYVPRCAYEIGAYTVERNGDLVVEEREMDETLIQTLLSEGLITEEIREEDCVEGTMATVAEADPARTAELDGLTISLPMTRHTADSLRRMVNLIYSRGPLLSKATGGSFGADKDLITALDDAGAVITAKAFIELVEGMAA